MPRTAEKKRPFKRLPKGPNGGIELLLIQSVDNLGRSGEVVEVKAGYAFNYLLPQGLATVATDHHKRMVEKHRAQIEELEKVRLADLAKQTAEISEQSLTIEANANEEGMLYGSVGTSEIVDALAEQGIKVEQGSIKLDGQLKELGLYTVKVSLHADIDAAEVKVWVVPSTSDEE